MQRNHLCPTEYMHKLKYRCQMLVVNLESRFQLRYNALGHQP